MTDTPHGTARFGAGALAPALLVAVAAIHMVLVHTAGLTPWKGGGFGMFSTVDASRVVRVTLEDDDRRTVVRASGYLGAKSWVSKLPTEFLLGAYATIAAQDVWVPSKSPGSAQADRIVSWRGHETPREVVVPERVKVATYRLRYDRATAELRLDAVRSASVAGPRPEQIARRLRVPVDALETRRIADVIR